MEKIKSYLVNNFEQSFILVILVSVFLINYYIPQKIAFLNFYFLPIILAGYYLGLRSSILGAFLCIVLVTIYVLLYPHLFIIPATQVDLLLHIFAWGGFLILSGTVVGKQQERLFARIQETNTLNEELQRNQAELKSANEALKSHSEDLETRVKERTSELERSKQAIESLKTKVEETLYTTMDSAVAKLMIEGRLRNEKRAISVMFSDLVDFTRYSEDRSPEMAIRDLNRFLNDMEPILLDYRGHIDKYLGDGIMAEFGVPLDFDNYCLMATMAALKMQEKMERVGDYPWKMRISIASGPAIMGLIGSRRKAYTTIGDVVNLSSRMEKTCPPGSITIDRPTYEGVKNFMNVRQMKDLSLSEFIDVNVESELDEMHQRLSRPMDTEEKAALYFEIGKLHMSLEEYHEALEYFENSIHLNPNNMDLKVAFTEASMKKDELERIKIRGKRKRVSIYEVLGLKDVLKDSEIIPESIYESYHHILDTISTPEDVVLPVEALDGSIGHSKVVALLSFAMASHLRISDLEKQEILHAGFVADIGKEIIPHHLLNRRGTLSPSELEEVKKHPTESIHRLKRIGYDSEFMLDIVRHSHENYNGSGYPDGLKGEDIPLGSRIVAVADAYAALISWRPYREQLEQNAVFYELQQSAERGTYDPKIVEVLKLLLE